MNEVSGPIGKKNDQDGQIFDQIAQFAGVVIGSSRLSRELSRPDVSIEAKKSVIDDLFQTLSGDVRNFAYSQVDSNHRNVASFRQHIFDTAVSASFELSKTAGTFDELTSGLFLMGLAVRDNVALMDALRESTASIKAKKELLTELFSGRVNSPALSLVKLLIDKDHGSDLFDALVDLQERAASFEGRRLTEITTAIEIDDNRKKRLAEAVEKASGNKVRARFVVDPTIGGAVVVRIGEQLWDGSIRTKLESAKQTIGKF